jgi:hypothetical protein
MSEVDDKKGVVVKFDPIEYEALRAIGDGNLSEGLGFAYVGQSIFMPLVCGLMTTLNMLGFAQWQISG